jgi:hypothetical protein
MTGRLTSPIDVADRCLLSPDARFNAGDVASSKICRVGRVATRMTNPVAGEPIRQAIVSIGVISPLHSSWPRAEHLSVMAR